MLEVEVCHTLTTNMRSRWNSLVEQSKLGSFFHRYEWLKSIEDGIGLEARHILVLRDGSLVGILPNFLLGVRHTPFKRLLSVSPGFGGPLISAGNEAEVLDLMLHAVSGICGGKIINHSITALDLGYVRYSSQLIKNGYVLKPASCRFTLDLRQSCESILNNMDSSKRKHLRNAMKQDIHVIDEAANEDNLREFYGCYRQVVRRHDSTGYPFSFFSKLKDNAPDRVRILSLDIGGRNAGSVLRLLDREQSSIHAYCSGVAPDYFKYYPAELLAWYAINWGVKNGYRTYDFGATTADFDDGIFRFKEEFGGNAVPTLSWERVFSKTRNKLVTVAKTIRQGNQGRPTDYSTAADR